MGARWAPRYLAVVAVVFVLLAALTFVPVVLIAGVVDRNLLPEEMGAAQSDDSNIIALPFDLRYWAALKLPRIAKEQPEVVWIGSSRGMEFRADMFRPYKFYNASLTAWTLDQEMAILERVLRVSKPRVAILGIDYFMLTNAYADSMNRERSMIFENGLSYRVKSNRNLIRELVSAPSLVVEIVRNWRTGSMPVKCGSLTLLGVDAIRSRSGFRFDGSMLVARRMYETAAAELAANQGVLQAAPGAPFIEPRHYKTLRRLAEFARRRGVTLVAVQLPMYKSTIDFLDHDAAYRYYSGIWREFESGEMRKTLKDMGFEFFDLARDSINSEADLFLDTAHMTEFGTSLAVTRLLQDERFHALFPLIDAARLRDERAAALVRGARNEIYGAGCSAPALAASAAAQH